MKHRPPKYARGDAVGIFDVLDGGDPAALAMRRNCRVRCRACDSVDVVSERWLTASARAGKSSCSACRPRGATAGWKISTKHWRDNGT